MRNEISVLLFGIACTTFLCFLYITWVDRSKTENCEQLAKHLNATKYDWISDHGCYIDGKYYG